jgi:hypothetical protein
LRGREEVVGVKVALVVVWTLVGLVVGMFVLGELGPLFGFRDMEGQSAMFTVMVGAPLGGAAGLLAAIGFVRAHAGNPRRLGQGLLIPIGLAAAIPFGIFLYEQIRTYDRIDSDGNPFDLTFQLRLPEGAPSPEGAPVALRLTSSKETPNCRINQAPYGLSQQNGRFILSGNCDLFYAAAERTLAVTVGDGPTYLYTVRIASRPTTATYSEWFPVDAVAATADGERRLPHPDEIAEIRYGAR